MGLGHIPVLLDEVLNYLNVRPGAKYIDSTVGGGGHAEAILEKGGVVLGIDQDPTSLSRARERFSSRLAEGESRQACPGEYQKVPPSERLRLVQGNFAHLQKIASENGFDGSDGILFDLGFASFQVGDASRGLSFRESGPLDMRLDPSLNVTAADLVNSLPKRELYELFSKIGEDKNAWRIASAIVREREKKPFQTTDELTKLILRVSGLGSRIHPVTKVYMALRIAVNTEFENLKSALPQAVELLAPGGRIAVISFHSGEDRIVKQFFRDVTDKEVLQILTQKPVVPSLDEIKANPAARSAKLRVAQKYDIQTSNPNQKE